MKKYLILAIFAFCALDSMAATESHRQEPQTDAAGAEASNASPNKLAGDDGAEDSAYAQRLPRSSQNGRVGKHFLLLIQPIGFIFPDSLDNLFGASLGYFLTSNTILSVDAEFGTSLEASDYDPHDSSSSFGVHLKYFYFRSFYLKGGVDHRTFETSSHQYSSDPYTTSRLSETGLDLAIGNQWQFTFFTFGCDWVTAFTPLQRNQTSNANGGGESSSNLEFFKTYVGVSF